MLATGENGYALPFEVVSILLLAAMVGCRDRTKFRPLGPALRDQRRTGAS
jgi:hypothetical protein